MRWAWWLDDWRNRSLIALALDQKDRIGLIGDLLVGQHAQALILQAIILRAILAPEMADDDHMESGLLQLGQPSVDRLHIAVDRGVLIIRDAGLPVGLGTGAALGVGAHGLENFRDRVKDHRIAGLAKLADLVHRVDQRLKRERL